MKISWKWDKDKNWDPYSLLGEIELIDEDGNSIKDNCTNIDSWVKPLMEGLVSLKNNKEKLIDLVIEPDPLEFIIQNTVKKIKYGSSSIIVKNEEVSLNALAKLSKKVVIDINSHNGLQDKVALKNLNEVANCC